MQTQSCQTGRFFKLLNEKVKFFSFKKRVTTFISHNFF